MELKGVKVGLAGGSARGVLGDLEVKTGRNGYHRLRTSKLTIRP